MIPNVITFWLGFLKLQQIHPDLLSIPVTMPYHNQNNPLYYIKVKPVLRIKKVETYIFDDKHFMMNWNNGLFIYFTQIQCNPSFAETKKDYFSQM